MPEVSGDTGLLRLIYDEDEILRAQIDASLDFMNLLAATNGGLVVSREALNKWWPLAYES